MRFTFIKIGLVTATMLTSASAFADVLPDADQDLLFCAATARAVKKVIRESDLECLGDARPAAPDVRICNRARVFGAPNAMGVSIYPDGEPRLKCSTCNIEKADKCGFTGATRKTIKIEVTGEFSYIATKIGANATLDLESTVDVVYEDPAPQRAYMTEGNGNGTDDVTMVTYVATMNFNYKSASTTRYKGSVDIDSIGLDANFRAAMDRTVNCSIRKDGERFALARRWKNVCVTPTDGNMDQPVNVIPGAGPVTGGECPDGGKRDSGG